MCRGHSKEATGLEQSERGGEGREGMGTVHARGLGGPCQVSQAATGGREGVARWARVAA